MAAIPLLDSGSSTSSGHPSLKGKLPGDLTFSDPVKLPQLWPPQYLYRLDSLSITYKDLNLLHFAFGFIECLYQSAVIGQSKIIAHLSHQMDLASFFQWPAVRAYHARVLKVLSYLSQIYFYGLNYSIFHGEVRYGYNFSVKVAKVKKCKV